MNFKLILCIGFLVIVFVLESCHEKRKHSQTLQEAYQIQQEALRIYHSIDKNSTKSTLTLEEKKKQWLENMIEIPGIDHDHKKCNHNHKPKTVLISDDEMLAVQMAWRDSIVYLKSIIESAK